jgi:hypothetical protein
MEKQVLNDMITWQFPWGYRKSLAIAIGLCLLGTLLEVLVDTPPPLIGFPFNLLIVIAFLTLAITAYRLKKHHPLVQWLTNLPAALSAISYFGVMTLIIGLVPQSSNLHAHSLLGFTHLWRSWQFFFAWLYLLTILTFVILKRAVPLSYRNIRFLVSHLGFWLIILAMALGAGDKHKLNLVLHQGKPESSGIDLNGMRQDLPFTLKLSEFWIEEYAPELLLMDITTGAPFKDRSKGEVFITAGLKLKLGGYVIFIRDFYPQAIPTESGFMPSTDYGNVPAAYIEALDSTGYKISGWITCGNFRFPAVLLKLDQRFVLIMNRPAPKQFASRITILTRDRPVIEAILTVNHPIKIKHWRLYQGGYDTTKGKWSQYSLIQAVKDPWLPVVYIGLVMVLAGVIMLVVSPKTNLTNFSK